MQFVQVHHLYKKRKAKSLGLRCFSMMGKSFSLTHYSSQFNNRELAQWSGTSEVSSHDRQLESFLWPWIEKLLQWPQAMQNINRCKESAVLSSDLNAFRETLSSLLPIQFISSECFGKLYFSNLTNITPYTLLRFPSGRIKILIYKPNKGENILSNSLTSIRVYELKVKHLTMICGFLL